MRNGYIEIHVILPFQTDCQFFRVTRVPEYAIELQQGLEYLVGCPARTVTVPEWRVGW